MISDKTIRLIILLLLTTIPLLFGARHPLIHGIYSSILLLFGGGALIFQPASSPFRNSSFLVYFPVILIAYIYCSSFPMPLAVLGILSPTRAESLIAARDIAGAIDLQSALSYYAPRATFYATYGLSLLCYFYLVLPHMRSKEFLRKLLWAITAIGSFEAFYGLLQAMNPEIGVLWLPAVSDQFSGCARGTIIYRNQYALFLNLCWPAAAALGFSLYIPVYTKFRGKLKKRRKVSLSQRITIFADKAVIPLLCCGVMMLAIIFSQSRGGIIVMFLVAILFGFFLPTTKKIKIGGALFLLSFLYAYGSLIGGFEGIASRFSQFIAGAEGRITIWLASVSMLKSHLLTGIGMGNYEYLSFLYLEGVPEKVWFDRAHNEYLELTIELGLPVAILLFVWLAAGVLKYFRLALSVKQATTIFRKMTLMHLLIPAAFCSLAAFLFHGFVDFVWRIPVNVVFMVTLLAILTTAGEDFAEEKVIT